MPRAGQVRVEPGQRLSDRVALGVLTATFPRQLVDEVIDVTGRREQRNRLLPAHLTVYYVLAMTLFATAGYEEVMRSLTEGLAWASDGAEDFAVPSQVAITKARARLGPEPLAQLFDRACVPLATPTTPGAFYRDWRLVSIDGTTIDVADTDANAAAFGRAGTGRGDGSAFPQLRVVALGECGTHAVIAARMGLLLGRRSHPGQAAGRGPAARDAVPGRPGLHRPPAVCGRRRQRRRAGVAGQGQRRVPGSAAPARRLVRVRAGRHRRQAPPRGRLHRPGHRVRPGRPGQAGRPGHHLPAGDHSARPHGRPRRRARRALRPALGDRVDLRRAQDPPARAAGDPALPHARRGVPGSLGLPVRALRAAPSGVQRGGEADPVGVKVVV